VRVVHARSAEAAVALLRAHAPQARPLALGGDLLGLWKDGVRERADQGAPVWVNLASAPALARIEPQPDGGWRLGAMATLAQLQRTPGLAPMLGEAAGRIASPQLRARSTLGGNLLQRPRCWYFRHPDIDCFKKGGRGCPAVGAPPQAHPGASGSGPCHAAHPSDLAVALLALDATAEIVGADGVRTVPLQTLYHGAAHNRAAEAQIAPDEVLAALRVPPQPPAQAFEKLAARAANEFAAASAAVLLHLDGGRIAAARVALGGIATEPLLLADAGAVLAGREAAALDVEALARQLMPRDRVDASRAALCRLAIERAVARALAAPR
jgi:xanthine dehydrogenase YagS FAD-binding subunit